MFDRDFPQQLNFDGTPFVANGSPETHITLGAYTQATPMLNEEILLSQPIPTQVGVSTGNMKRPGEGRHVEGIFFSRWKEQTVTEREAVEIFREFTPQEMAEVISVGILRAPIVVEASDPMHAHGYNPYHPYTLEDYVKTRHEKKPREDTPGEVTRHLREGRPDLYNLYHVVDYALKRFPSVIVTAYPDRFARLINTDGLSETDQARMITVLGERQNMSALYFGMLTAFTPTLQRETRAEVNHLRSDQAAQISEHTPDVVTGHESPGARLSAFAEMFSMSHDDAVRIVCERQGVPYELLPNLRTEDRKLFAAIHAAAGQYLRRNSFVGALHDSTGVGRGSVYDFRSSPHAVSADTERGSCTAYAFHDALVQGLGLALKENHQTIWQLISDPLVQVNDYQRHLYQSLSLTLEHPEAFPRATPSVIGGWVLDRIVQELRSPDSTPAYAALLRVLQEDAWALGGITTARLHDTSAGKDRTGRMHSFVKKMWAIIARGDTFF